MLAGLGCLWAGAEEIAGMGRNSGNSSINGRGRHESASALMGWRMGGLAGLIGVLRGLLSAL